MNKEATDALFEALQAIENQNTRLSALEEKVGKLFNNIDKLEKYVDSEISSNTDKILTTVLDKVSIEHTNDINVDVDTSKIASAISKFDVNPVNNITVEPQDVSVTIDTKEISKLLDNQDNTKVLELLVQQISNLNSDNKQIVKDLIKIQKDQSKPIKEKTKKINIIRNKDNLPTSLEVIN